MSAEPQLKQQHFCWLRHGSIEYLQRQIEWVGGGGKGQACQPRNIL